MAALRGLANVFPGLPLITAAVAELSRQLEICADDAAARRHGRRALLSGLIALPDGAVFSRAERLILPPTLPAQARDSATLAGLWRSSPQDRSSPAALAASGVLICAT